MKRFFSGLLVCVFLLGLLPAAALAAEGDVSYLFCDSDGQNWRTGAKQNGEYAAVTSSDTVWGTAGSESWYVARGTVTISSRVTVNGTVHLILVDGCTLTIEMGIRVATGNSFVIYAQSKNLDTAGQLLASTSSWGRDAAIGGNSGDGGENCGNITINGGIVEARGCWYGAGIGGGAGGINHGQYEGGTGGNVVINSGFVTAYGSDNAAGIGGGEGNTKGGDGGTLIINGGIVFSNRVGGGGVHAAEYVGNDGTSGTFSLNDGIIVASDIQDTSGISNWNGLVISDNNGGVYGTDSFTLDQDMEIPQGYGLKLTSGQTLTVAEGVVLTNSGEIINSGTISGALTNSSSGEISNSGMISGPLTNNGVIVVGNNGSIPENVTGNGTIEKVTGRKYLNDAGTEQDIPGTAICMLPGMRQWKDGWYIVCSNVSFDERVAVSGNVHLILADGCSLNAEGGINVSNGNSLTVYCQPGRTGALTAVNPGNGGAAIGANRGGAAGSIVINGGIITAKVTSMGGACIGMGGWGGAAGSVTINGGYLKLTADKGDEGAFGNAYSVNGGIIEYTGKKDTICDNLNNCVIFKGNDGQVYGSALIAQNYIIPQGKTLTIPEGNTLTINSGVTLTNNGTLTNSGIVTNNGILTNNGTVDGSGSYSGTGTVDKASQTAPGTGEGYTIDYITETITASSGYEVSSSNSSVENVTDIPGKSVYVRKAESDFYNASDWTSFIAASRPTAPTGLQGIAVSIAGKQDGQITGVSADMEYKLSTADSWTACTGTEINGLAAGTYQVRLKATASTFASEAAPVTVPSGQVRTYTLTVNSGTGSGSYAAGATVTITATAPSSQRFTGWTVNAGSITLADAGSATTTFTMPAGNVTVTANFENIPAPTFLVTVNGGTGGGSYTEDATVTITATVPSGQRFTGWTVNAGGVTLADVSSATTTFTMPARAVTVTANFQSNSGGGGGGSYTPPTYKPDVSKPSGGGGEAPAVSPSNPKQGDTVTVTPKPDDGYEVDKITVTDRNGKPVEVTKKPDGTYTFVQPGGQVTIEIEYAPVPLTDLPWNNPFTDVSEGDWYYEAVRFVRERDLMNGYSDGRFGPNDTLSRAQLAQILFNKEGRPGVNYLLTFSDVAGEAWYTEAIRWATSQGIVGGYGDGTFGPNAPITREQLAVMLWRYSGSPAATDKELHFNDADEISPFAPEAMRWAVENGILNGYGNGRLGPQGQATRAQVAQMLKNFIENQESK